MILLSQNKKLSAIYFSFILAVILNFIPSVTVQTFGGVLFITVFIYTYIVKYTSDKESIDRNHACYIIKTIWIFTLFTLIGIIIAYAFGDHTLINNFVDDIQNGVIPTEDQMMSLLIEYSYANAALFAIVFVPITLHLVYRLSKGISLARKNAPISNPKSWL